MVETKPKSGLMKVDEVAEYLRISRASLYSLISKGLIPSVKIGKSRRIASSVVSRLVREGLPS